MRRLQPGRFAPKRSRANALVCSIPGNAVAKSYGTRTKTGRPSDRRIRARCSHHSCKITVLTASPCHTTIIDPTTARKGTFRDFATGSLRSLAANPPHRLRRITKCRPSGRASAVKLKSLYQPMNSNRPLNLTRQRNSCGKKTLAGTRPLMIISFP